MEQVQQLVSVIKIRDRSQRLAMQVL
jgi:hypothetical protein